MPTKTLLLPRHLGSAIRKRRKQLNITQAGLAQKSQTSRRLITSLELGDADGIALNKVIRILEALDMTLSVTWQKPCTDQQPADLMGHAPLTDNPHEPSYQDAFDDIVIASLRQAASTSMPDTNGR